MQQLLLESLSAAMPQLQMYADHNLDESIVRFLVMVELKRVKTSVTVHTEWIHHVDLLVQSGLESALVEFKFYSPRRLYSLTGEHLPWNGGASLKNEDGFRKCLDKLRGLQVPGIQHRFLVLAYAATTEKPSKYSLAASYGNLERFGFDRVDIVQHPYADIVCKLSEVD